MFVYEGFVQLGGTIFKYLCGFLDQFGADLHPKAHVASRFISAVVGFGYSGKGKRPSSRENVLHLIFVCHARVTKELGNMAFHPYPVAETEALSRFATTSAMLLFVTQRVSVKPR